MDDNLPQPKSVQRRIRRRAVRAVGHQLALQDLRNVIEREHQDAPSETDSSGNVSSEGHESSAESDDGGNVATSEVDRLSEDQDVEVLDERDNGMELDQDAEEEDPGVIDVEHAHIPPEDDANMTPDDREAYLKRCLQEWATSGGVLSMRKVDELLGKLSRVFKSIPKSYKTLLTTAPTVHLYEADDYKMWYKGIRSNLDQFILDDYIRAHGSISIDVNMDGLPLNKNVNKKKFWPILGKLKGSVQEPFVIGIYCGTCDPKDIDMFLGDFIVEVQDLIHNGYECNGQTVRFEVNNFILDAPARSLVKCCISHGGYGACEKCCVVGEYKEGRVHYANVPVDCAMRTDQSFLDRTDRLHHVGRSPLEFINIGMVSQFRLDTMHLVHKGVFLRLLEAIFTWVGPWNPDVHTLRDISSLLERNIRFCPRDFNRKPRNIQEYYKYKATELRRLLLYDGVVAFKGKLRPEIYQLYLLLHCGIYILSSSYFLSLMSDEAEECIKNFIQFSAQTFGEHFVVYNVHSLCHLVDECREHGPVEAFSAFPFENELKTIKQMLRSGYQPLEQIIKRDSERTQKKSVKLKSPENSVKLFQPHRGDEGELENLFNRICVNGVTLKIGDKDSCFMTNNGVVAVLERVVKGDGNHILLCGRRFNNSDSVYSYPFNSANLGILKVWGLNDVTEMFELADVFSKCWLMRDGLDFVSLPLFVLLAFDIPDEEGSSGDTEMEIACKKWLKLDDVGNVTCLWPKDLSDPQKLKVLVTKHAQPDETWIPHPCHIVSGYSNYLDAHIGLKRRLEDSTYETEKELGSKRRKKKPRRLSSSEEEIDLPSQRKQTAELQLPAPPKITLCSDKVSFKAVSTKKSPIKILPEKGPASKSQASLKIVRADRGSKAKSLEDLKAAVTNRKQISEQKMAEKKNKPICTSPGWKVRATVSKQCSEDIAKSPSLDDPADCSSFSLQESATKDFSPELVRSKTKPDVVKDLFGTSASFSHVKEPSQMSNLSKPTSSSGDFEKNVLVILNEINQKVEVISANQSKLNLHLIPNEKVLARPEGMPTMPLQTTADLKEIENILEEDASNISLLSIYLSTHVNKDPAMESVSAKKVMVALVSNSVAKEYSLKGKKGKLKFEDLKLWSAVQGAILLKLETDLVATEKAVQRWLKDAAWRKQSDGSQQRSSSKQ